MTLDETAMLLPNTSSENRSDAVLQELDHAKFQWFHVKAILISGIGFFTDAYDLFMVSIISPMIGFSRYPELHGKLPVSVDTAIKGIALCGTLLGQVVFGVLGDQAGRKKVYGLTLITMIAATVMSVVTAYGPNAVMITMFCFWRFVLGVGIGGDYPLSAVITSEYANTRWRGAMIAAVFSMQGLGIVSASVVALIVIQMFKGAIQDCTVGEACGALDHVWRISVAIGVIPAAATYYLRKQLPETPRFTLHIKQDAELATQHVQMVLAQQSASTDAEDNSLAINTKDGSKLSWKEFRQYCGRWQNLKVLLGCCACWFLLDVAFYANNLFTPTVMQDIGYVPKVPPASIYEKVYKVAAGNAIVAMMGTVPGYWFAVGLIEVMGRKPMQYMGFIAMTVFLVLMASLHDVLHEKAMWAYICIYALMSFFSNFGPNTTTFIVPGECFPTKYRSTCHGISAATGKAGAIVGAFGMGHLYQTRGTKLTVGILAIFTAVGALFTALIPETKGRSLEDISKQDQPPSFNGFSHLGKRPSSDALGVQLVVSVDATHPSDGSRI